MKIRYFILKFRNYSFILTNYKKWIKKRQETTDDILHSLQADYLTRLNLENSTKESRIIGLSKFCIPHGNMDCTFTYFDSGFSRT